MKYDDISHTRQKLYCCCNTCKHHSDNFYKCSIPEKCFNGFSAYEPNEEMMMAERINVMTKLTANGATTTNAPGQEQYETFSRKVGGKTKKYYQYDYRHTNGELFSCVKPTLEACRACRDEWLERKCDS